MALNDAATLVVGAGNYFTNPTVGTALPVDLSTPNAGLVDPATMWDNVGHTSLEDIFSMSSEGGEATVLATLQNKTLRTSYSPRTETINFTLQQFDEAGLKLFYGSNATVGAGGELQVPVTPTPTICSFLVVFLDGENEFAFYAPKAEIYRADDLNIADTESLAGLPIGVKPVIHGTNKWAFAVTPLASV